MQNTNYDLISGKTFAEVDELRAWIDNGAGLEGKFMFTDRSIFVDDLGTTGQWVDWSDTGWIGLRYVDDNTFRRTGGGMGLRRLYGRSRGGGGGGGGGGGTIDLTARAAASAASTAAAAAQTTADTAQTSASSAAGAAAAAAGRAAAAQTTADTAQTSASSAAAAATAAQATADTNTDFERSDIVAGANITLTPVENDPNAVTISSTGGGTPATPTAPVLLASHSVTTQNGNGAWLALASTADLIGAVGDNDSVEIIMREADPGTNFVFCAMVSGRLFNAVTAVADIDTTTNLNNASLQGRCPRRFEGATGNGQGSQFYIARGPTVIHAAMAWATWGTTAVYEIWHIPK